MICPHCGAFFTLLRFGHRPRACVAAGLGPLSPGRGIRNFTWSGATGDNIPERGVFQGSIDSYSPQNASTRPFDMNFLKVDSTDAFETAQKHGGALLLKKTPDMLIKYQLIWDPRASRLSWSVKYAPSGASQKLDAVIDASTGQFIHIAK